jgi:hypothetical protein
MHRLALVVVFVLMSLDSMAGDGQIGDWHLSLDDEQSKAAFTVNAAGDILGQFCFYRPGGDPTCFYEFAMDLTCKEGEQYPVLVNTDVGAAHELITCGKPLEGGKHVYYFSFESMDSTVKNATRLGIVFPTQGDSFRVSRFSLSGSRQAIETMREDAERTLRNYRPARESL